MAPIARLAAILMLVVCAPLYAGDGDGPAPDHHARYVPANVDLSVTLVDARSWRTGPSGAPALELLEAFLQTGEAGEAWAEFAAQLGVDPEEAFDRLLGMRATLARRVDDGRPTWVLLSAIEAETSKRLLSRLNMAPRGLLNGLTIFAVEGGRFRMSIAKIGGQKTLVLGPASAPALLDEVVGSLRDARRRSIASLSVFRALVDARADANAILLFRSIGADGLTAITLRTDGLRIGARLAMDSDVLRGAYGAIPEWDASPLEHLDQDAYLASLEWTPATKFDAPALAGFELIDRLLDMPFDAEGSLDARRGVVILPSPDGIATGALLLESSDIDGVAVAGDRFVAQSMADLWPGGGAQIDAIDLAGEFPGAVRRLDLREPLGLLALPLFAEGPELAWRYIVSGGEPGRREGWWVIGIGAEGVELASKAASRRSPAGSEAVGRWVTRGEARPRAALDELARRGVPTPKRATAYTEILRRIERIAWSARIDDEGLILGHAELDCLALGGRRPVADR